MLSLMLVVICLGFVVAGTLSFLIFIGFSSPFLELRSTMMVGMVLLPILWFGLLVPSSRGAGWFMLFGSGPFCPGRLLFGSLSGFVCLLLPSVLMTLPIGPIPQVFWLSGFPFWGIFTGLLVVLIWELVVSLTLSCSFFMNFGLVRGCLWRRFLLAIFGKGVQFQCWLFRLVQRPRESASVPFLNEL